MIQCLVQQSRSSRWPALALFWPRPGPSSVTSRTYVIRSQNNGEHRERDFTDFYVAYFMLFWSWTAFLWYAWLYFVSTLVIVHEPTNQRYRAEANLSQPHQVQRGAAVASSQTRSSRLETPVRDKVFVLLVVRIACTRCYNLQVKLVTRRLKEASTWSEGATCPPADWFQIRSSPPEQEGNQHPPWVSDW